MNLKKKAIRVGIAAALCMLASHLLKLKFPFFVILPAVMPISTFFGETIKFGINRIVGSFIGAIIGVILVTIKSENMFLIGLGVIIIIYVCNYLKWDSTTSIACLVFISIMVGIKGSSAFMYSVHRLLDTFIGIAITTVINNYIFNPDAVKTIKKEVESIQENLLNLANVNGFMEDKNELEHIEWRISVLKGNYKIYSEELKIDPKSSSMKDKLSQMIYALTIIFEQIKVINYINSNNSRFIEKDKDIDTVLSFHKNIFFNEMKNLNNIIGEIR